MDSFVANSLSPLPQLSPHLHQGLNLPWTRNAVVSDPALLICPLVKIPHSRFAEVSQVVAKLLKFVLAQDFRVVAVGTPSHKQTNASIFAVCSPTKPVQ